VLQIAGFPVGCNSHNALIASTEGTVPFTTAVQTQWDACLNPWKGVACGAWDDGELGEETGTRASIMEAFTAHNPKVCLTADDLEAINTLYPVCTGHDMTVTTAQRWNCGKAKQRIGWVRVLVWVFVPVILIMCFQMLILSRLKHHEEHKLKEKEKALKETQVVADRAQRHKEKAEKRASVATQALQVQIATEDARVEERAHELAAQKIQAQLRRKKSAKKVEGMREQRKEMIRQGTQGINLGADYPDPQGYDQRSNRAPAGMPPQSKV